MNVYACWYQGNYGYACRTRGSRWMFVPELGQADNMVYRNLSLHELVFKNTIEKSYEFNLEKNRNAFSPAGLLKRLFLPGQKQHTVGGLLFSRS